MSFSKQLSLASIARSLCVILAVISSCDATPVHDHKHVSMRLAARQGNGPGIVLSNKSGQSQTYAFFNNDVNGFASFTNPLKSATVDAGATQFVPLDPTFKGRVQRGVDLPATWVEFQLAASNDNAAHGDVSLEQGCDGAATITATDGSGRTNGFTHDIMAAAPTGAILNKPDGTKALASTMGNWLGGPNQAAIDYENSVVGQTKAYIVGGTGVPDVASSNQQFAVDFY